MTKRNETLWYPIRVTYSQEMKIKELMTAQEIESFIPMEYREKERNGRKMRQLVPVIHNLIFIHTCKRKIDEIKAENMYSYIRYLTNPTTNTPIIVPEKQMTDFIAVAGTPDEQIMFLGPTEVNLQKGDRVRITGGIWEGVEGTFLRIKRGLRVVISIDGIMTVATASLHPSLVEKINDNNY